MVDPITELTDTDAPTEDDGGDRTPPHSILAEQSVLGSMMLSTDVVDDVMAAMAGSDLYGSKHEVLWDAIMGLHWQGQPTDVVAVTEELTKRGHLQRAGGANYLHTLTGVPTTAANADYYAGIVAEKAVLRRLVAAGTRIVNMGYASEGEPDVLVSSAQAEIDQVISVGRKTVRRVGDTLMATVVELDEPATFLPTPFQSIDKLIGGFAPGSLVVVAARPGAGKSNFVLQVARRAAWHGLVAFASLEMTEKELQLRLISQKGEVSMTSIHRHSLIEDEQKRVAWARADLQEAPIFIDESEQATVASIANFARAVQRKGTATSKLEMIVVDYLQLVDGEGQNREQIVGNVAKSLKQLAKRLQVPIVVAAQLNRGERGRGRELPLPTMRDLRESGGIEANADVVLLLHRDTERFPDKVRVIAAKNRQGTTGVVTLRWQGEYSRMVDRPWSPTLDMEETE